MVESANIVEETSDEILTLRKITKNDVDFIFKSLNYKELTSFLSLGPLNSLDHSKRLIKGYLKYWDSYLQFNYIIQLNKPNKVNIGSISLWNINWQHFRAQIGIWLVPLFWGKGFAKRSLNLIKNVAFLHLKLNRLEAYIAIDNKRSIKLFESCSFQKEGILKKYLKFQNSFHDALIMACFL
jgi:RimJ/RimL family protein N-acetyltransferase